MKFVELKRRDGCMFLLDIDSAWEIHDRGDAPAQWVNNREGRNLDCANTYEEIRAKLLAPAPMTPNG